MVRPKGESAALAEQSPEGFEDPNQMAGAINEPRPCCLESFAQLVEAVADEEVVSGGGALIGEKLRVIHVERQQASLSALGEGADAVQHLIVVGTEVATKEHHV